MYTNLTVLLSVFLLVNGLDLKCSIETIEKLFITSSPSSSETEKKCELCQILKSKLDITHCQSNLLPVPCIANYPPSNNNIHFHHFPSQEFNFNQTDSPSLVNHHKTTHHQQTQAQPSIQWVKSIPSSSNSNSINNNNNGKPIFHVLIKRSNNNKVDDHQDEQQPIEYLYLTFREGYPKILPKICQQRKDPVESPFGHVCPPNTECVEDESVGDGYICVCNETCTRTWLVRKILEWIQIVCIVFCVLAVLVVYWLRKTKTLTTAIWPITESILFGSILLYISVILKIEIPSYTALLCVIEPWTRELGFTLLYGGIILKIYRSLVEFRTRKAHRWVVREKDILRYLGTMSVIIVFYMTSWTVTNKYYSGGEDFYDHLYCPLTDWHRLTEFGELLFLCVGLNMAWHLRRAPPSPYKSYYTTALIIEITTNVLGIVIRECRFIFVEEDDDEVFLMVLHFIRCQLTTTIIIVLVIAPKLYYIREEKRKRQLRRGDTTSSAGGLVGRKALEAINNGDLEFLDINIADMDPQDIRLELKRVYTQLELLRNKTMRKDNPHISKRRGGRKPTHRRFSLQALRRQQQQQHYQQQPQTQRSFRGYAQDDIEDSVCSIEGPSCTYSEAGR